MPVISFASPKGGAGRTTSAILLATALVPAHRVFLIDADPAQQVMAWAQKKQLVPHLQVQASAGEQVIRDEIRYARRQSDFVILDLDNAASRLNATVMGESDLVIVPTGDEHQEAEAAIAMLAHVKRMARELDQEIPAQILFTRTSAIKSQLEKSLNAQLRERTDCFMIELVNRPAFSALHSYGGMLLKLDPTKVPDPARASGNAHALADEVQNVLRGIPSPVRKSA